MNDNKKVAFLFIKMIITKIPSRKSRKQLVLSILEIRLLTFLQFTASYPNVILTT